MEQTKDYSIFKFKTGNRTVNVNHIKKLKELIQKHGYLQSQPIIVNKDMEVLDGQHRLRACSELGIPIYYIIEDKPNLLVDLNISQLKWSAKDFVKYYALEQQNPHYQRLMMLLNLTQIDIASIVGLAKNMDIGGCYLDKIKKGELTLEAHEMHQAKVQWANILQLRDALHIKITGRLVKAVTTLIQYPRFTWSTMFDKAIKYRVKAYDCTTKQEYIDMLVYIYNIQTRTDKRINKE